MSQEAISNTKSLEEKVKSDQRAPKMATMPSSQTKCVPERLTFSLLGQDELSFKREENDDNFVSGIFRKK